MDTSSLAVNPSVPPAPAPLVLLSTRDPPPVWVKLLTLSEMLPALPILVVLLRTCAPPVRLRVFAFSKMLPALPAPDVATDIVPPSAIVNVGTGAKAGADTVICPAFPVLEAVLNNPLGRLPLSQKWTWTRSPWLSHSHLDQSRSCCFRPEHHL